MSHRRGPAPALRPSEGTPTRAALLTGKYQQLVNENRIAASELDVTGTPTFFINGQKLVGNQPIENFQQAIDAALEASN